MSGSKPFASSSDYPTSGPASGKQILSFDPETPIRFKDLIDVISSYVGQAGKFLVVNQTEDGITVSTASSITEAISSLAEEVDVLNGMIIDAADVSFGKNIDFEQYQAKHFRLEQLAEDPAEFVSGQMWYNTTTKTAKYVEDGTIQPFFSVTDAASLLGIISDIESAQSEITLLSGTLDNIASDSVLSRNEKPVVKKEYDAILAEKAGLDTNAGLHGIVAEKTAYDDAVTALTAYLSSLDPAYDDFAQDTDITRETFAQKFNDVYAAKQNLLNAISSSVKQELAEVSQESSEASDAAAAAVLSAASALEMMETMTSDGVLSSDEKIKLVLEYSKVTTEQAGIDAEADEHGVVAAKTSYDNALTALTAYLTGLNPAWNNTSLNTLVNRNDFNSAWALLYSTRQVLLNAIARSALAAAQEAQADATEAISSASTAQSAAEAAQTDATTAKNGATAANAEITAMSSDTVLSKSEKINVIRQYNEIAAEKILLDAKATLYEIVAEKTAYGNAVTALTAYLGTLNPAWNDITQNTTIVPATFNAKFQDVYNARTALYLLIYDKAKSAATAAADTAAAEAHAQRTQLVINEGIVSAGRFEVGDQAYGDNNAGMSGMISGTPATDIRFWCGTTFANRANAPWRVQHDGTMYASKGNIAGWTIDTEAIFTGAKKITDGYSDSGITLAANGSVHSKKFCINTNGDVYFESVNSIFNSSPVGEGAYRGGIKIAGNQITEPFRDDDLGGIFINKTGYNGGTTRKRMVVFGDGQGNDIAGFGATSSFPTGAFILIVPAMYLGSLPTSSAGLQPGQVFRDGAGLNAVLKVV